MPPGTNFNLSGFTLQLPTGTLPNNFDSKTGVQLAAGFVNSPWFYTDSSDGAMVMGDPAHGVTTSGSLHPRTEFRETFEWPTSGTNVLNARVAVTQVPDHTAIAQIFQAPNAPSKPLCELQYFANGDIKLLLEDTNQGGSSTSPKVASVTPGSTFTYALQLSGTTITVTINGTSQNFTMDSSFNGEKFYFKAGNYDQSAVSGTPDATAATVVKFYALSITHQ